MESAAIVRGCCYPIGLRRRALHAAWHALKGSYSSAELAVGCADHWSDWGEEMASTALNGVERRDVIAVVGAGLMGHGIAQVFAAAGHSVRVHDSSAAALASLHERVGLNLDRLGLGADILSKITTHRRLEEALLGADFVCEAALEDAKLKQDLVARIDRDVATEVIIATNTSSIPIATVAERCEQKQRVIGVHWWNPPYLIPLVEVIQGDETAMRTVQWTLELVRSVGKLAVHVRRDVPGFIGNRLLHAMWHEAICLVQSGVCDAETVDLVVKNSFGLRSAVLGPLENADLVGLDLTLEVHEQILPFLDRSGAPEPLLRQKVTNGELGMKTGRGFYSWTPEKERLVREKLTNHLVSACHPSKDNPAAESLSHRESSGILP